MKPIPNTFHTINPDVKIALSQVDALKAAGEKMKLAAGKEPASVSYGNIESYIADAKALAQGKPNTGGASFSEMKEVFESIMRQASENFPDLKA